MLVHEALITRRSIRRFLPDPVPTKIVERILEGARFAPSGHNIQPWHVYVLTGNAKERVSAAILKAMDNDPAEQHQPEFDYYPIEWFDPYIGRRRKLGFDLYSHLGIAREDTAGRDRQMRKNYTFFDAPVGMFVTFDRRLATGTFMDIGMFIENILIAARGEGLHTCAQACFNWYHNVVRAELGFSEQQQLVCGISLGVADPDAAENRLRAEKVSVAQFSTFLEA